MLLSLRNTYDVPNDVRGNAVLMALVARPPFRNGLTGVNMATDAIRQYAAYGFYRQHGYDHPDNPHNPKRSSKDRLMRLDRVFFDFNKGLEAGRMFLSSLAASDPASAKRGFGESKFRFGSEVFGLRYPAISHLDVLTEAVREKEVRDVFIEPKNIRQERWDRWVPTIHIAAAFVLLFDSNSKIQGDKEWRSICRSLLFNDNDHVPKTLVSNANLILQCAEDNRFFPKATPLPLLLRD